MATTPAPPSPRHSSPSIDARGTLVEYEQYIEQQLGKTGSRVRNVDLACALMTLAVALLVFFLTVALIDHWLVPGGLGFWGRLVAFFALLGMLGYHAATRIVPLLLRRINPVYAAHTIERSKPGLKNSLINFLLFRSNPGGLSRTVFEAIEEQAAHNLARVPVDLAVDRSKLILIGYVLLGVLLASAAYELFSPKDPLRTAGRVIMPWADIQPPTRTTITAVQPGNASAFRGERVVISAEVRGVAADDPVRLVVSTADGQVVDRAIPMQVPADGYRHAAELGAQGEGLQQTTTYRIEAGDCVTKDFRLEVVAAPTIVVQAVDYVYPEYTGLLPQTVEGQGDIKAIEGTEVTLHALANQPIQSATIDLGGDGAHPQRMRAEGDRAHGSFTLEMNAERTAPWHGSYRVKFKNEADQENPQPVLYRLEVTPDLAPELSFLAPRKEEIELPANAAITCEIVAHDPDFALRRVRLVAKRGSRELLDKVLLDEGRPGQFNAKVRISAHKLGLKPGDAIEYWAVAEDNKQPRPNRVETAKRRLTIVAPVDQQAGGADQPPMANQDQIEIEPEQQPGDKQKPNDADPAARDDARQQRESADKQDQQRDADQPPNSSPDEDQGPDQPNNGEQSSNDKDQRDQGKQSGQDKQSNEDKSERDKARKSDGRQPPDDGQQRDGEQQRQPGQQGDGEEQQQGGQSGDEQQSSGGQSGGAEKGKSGKGKKGAGTGEGEAGGQSGDKDTDARSKPAGADEQERRDTSPVASDGSNDGDAMERILEHRRQNERDAQQETGSSREGAAGQSSDPDGRGPGQPDRKGRETPANQRGADPQAGNNSSDEQRTDQRQPNKGTSGDRSAEEQQSGEPQHGDDARQPDRAVHNEQRPDASADRQQDGGGDRRGPSSAKPDLGQADKSARDQQPRDSAKQSGTPSKKPAEGRKPDQTNRDPTQDADKHDTEGQGAQSKGSAREDRQKRPSDADQRPDAKGGDPNENKGESGAGREGRDNQGSPCPQESNRQQRKTQSNMKEQKNRQEGDDPAKSPAGSKHESDSQSNAQGDRKGGGGEGGGQKSDKPGTGGAGKNTASDEGAGASPEEGEGQTGDEAGDQQQANKPTGKQSNQRGQGSGSAPQPKDAQSPGGDASPPDAPPSPDARSQPSKTAKPGTSGLPQGGGKPPDGDFQPFSAPNEEAPPAEKANLEYAKKATDLALQHLRDQLKKEEPDQELLDRLGWTRDDLAQFLRRWEAMQARAKTHGKEGDTAKRELDETLRSLGLRPKSSSLQSNAARDDQSRGLKETPRVAPPPEYTESYKAYTRGTARDD